MSRLLLQRHITDAAVEQRGVWVSIPWFPSFLVWLVNITSDYSMIQEQRELFITASAPQNKLLHSWCVAVILLFSPGDQGLFHSEASSQRRVKNSWRIWFRNKVVLMKVMKRSLSIGETRLWCLEESRPQFIRCWMCDTRLSVLFGPFIHIYGSDDKGLRSGRWVMTSVDPTHSVQDD